METLWPSDYLLKPHVGAAKRKNEGYMWDSYQGRPTRGYRAEPGYTAWLLGISLPSFFIQCSSENYDPLKQEFWIVWILGEHCKFSPLPEPWRPFKCSFTGPRSSNAPTVLCQEPISWPCLKIGLHSRFWVAKRAPRVCFKATLSAKQEP